MTTPLEISFHGLERSDAVEARIQEKFERLRGHFDRMTHARVVIDAPQRRTPLPKLFHVKIEIGIPGHKPVVAKYVPTEDRPHSDVMLAIRDAFTAAKRQLDAIGERMGPMARKHERARRRPRVVEQAEA